MPPFFLSILPMRDAVRDEEHRVGEGGRREDERAREHKYYRLRASVVWGSASGVLGPWAWLTRATATATATPPASMRMPD